MPKSVKKKTLTMPVSKYRKERREDAAKVMDTCLMAMLWALHNTEGFGEKRLVRVLEETDRIADYISEHRLTVKDIRRTLKEETGLSFRQQDTDR